MAFPTDPSDGQIYTSPLGTVYEYSLANDAWYKLTGGTQGDTGLQGVTGVGLGGQIGATGIQGVTGIQGSTGVAAVPGADTQVIFNDLGNFGTDGDLTFNKGTGTLNVGKLFASDGGSAATPVIQVGATDTGFFSSVTDNLFISAGGTQVARFYNPAGDAKIEFSPNGGIQFAITSTGSAATYVTATGSVAGFAPILTVGGESNRDIRVMGSGTGGVFLQDRIGVGNHNTSHVPVIGMSGSFQNSTDVNTGSNSQYGMYVQVRANASIGATSWVSGDYVSCLGDGGMGDGATLTNMRCSYLQYGLYSTAHANSTINSAVGLFIAPYAMAGTINYMYDIFVDGVSSGGTVNNGWSYYQNNSKANFFGGTVYAGGNAGAYLQLSGSASSRPTISPVGGSNPRVRISTASANVPMEVYADGNSLQIQNYNASCVGQFGLSQGDSSNKIIGVLGANYFINNSTNRERQDTSTVGWGLWLDNPNDMARFYRTSASGVERETLRITGIDNSNSYVHISASSNGYPKIKAAAGSLELQSGGASAIYFSTGADTAAKTQMVIGHTANATSYIQIKGSTTDQPSVQALGGGGNPNLNLYCGGVGNIDFRNGGASLLFRVANTSSSSSYLQVTGSTGNFPTMEAKGTGNVHVLIKSQTSGDILLQNGFGNLLKCFGSSGKVQVWNTFEAVNFTANGSAGVNFSGAVSNITVVGGIVTAAS